MRQPPEGDGEIGRWRLDDPAQLRELRDALQRMTDRATATEVAERLLLVATELAGNALRHGDPPVIVALRADGHVVVDVSDGAVDQPPTVDEHRPAGAGGLGLKLAEHLAEDVGWYRDPAGKHVWAAFERSR